MHSCAQHLLALVLFSTWWREAGRLLSHRMQHLPWVLMDEWVVPCGQGGVGGVRAGELLGLSPQHPQTVRGEEQDPFKEPSDACLSVMWEGRGQ